MPKKLPKNSTYHNPVLLQSAVHYLAVQPGGHYVDCTLGGGGHTTEIIGLGGLVLGLDQDPDALQACPDLDHLTKVRSNFIHLSDVVREFEWQPVRGILIDLGVSEHQINTPERGFSFQSSGPLDMRMDPSLSNTAATLVNQLPVEQLASIFKDFGQIPVAKPLALKIISARPLATTDQLAKITAKWSRQAFQALRIVVNDELGALSSVLVQARDILAPQGRLVVISFHSLEDRIVKNTMKDWITLTPKPVIGEKNAKLRAYEKNT